jgi:hypothetical protein
LGISGVRHRVDWYVDFNIPEKIKTSYSSETSVPVKGIIQHHNAAKPAKIYDNIQTPYLNNIYLEEKR